MIVIYAIVVYAGFYIHILSWSQLLAIFIILISSWVFYSSSFLLLILSYTTFSVLILIESISILQFPPLLFSVHFLFSHLITFNHPSSVPPLDILPRIQAKHPTLPIIQFIQKPGDTVFVPGESYGLTYVSAWTILMLCAVQC